MLLVSLVSLDFLDFLVPSPDNAVLYILCIRDKNNIPATAPRFPRIPSIYSPSPVTATFGIG